MATSLKSTMAPPPRRYRHHAPGTTISLVEMLPWIIMDTRSTEGNNRRTTIHPVGRTPMSWQDELRQAMQSMDELFEIMQDEEEDFVSDETEPQKEQ